jgi:hypothetical protein
MNRRHFSELLSRKILQSNVYTFTTQNDVTKLQQIPTSRKKNRLPQPCNSGRLSSAIWFGVVWGLVADVSGKYVGLILKSQVARIFKLSQNFGNIPLTNTAKYPSSNPRLVLCTLA